MNRFVFHCLVFAAILSACEASPKNDIPADSGMDTGDTGEPSNITYPRQMETLGRGVVAVHLGDASGVYVGWRLLGNDPEEISFDVYRHRGTDDPVKVNDAPLSATTDFTDPDGDEADAYSISVLDGASSETETEPVTVLAEGVKRIPLQGAYGTSKVAVGDLDGDGEFDYVIKQPRYSTDPGVFSKPPDTYKIEAYRSDGTFLWQKDLGWNIVQGEWWSPLLVYDLDGDGRAEVATKTAPVDEDYRNEDGRVLEGPEWLSILDGETGEEKARANWIPRGDVSEWGDAYGNRVNRNKLAVAYLDGRRPSLIVFRGIYRLMKVEAWNYRDGALTRLWRWAYEKGGGFRDVQVGDLDGDGHDEIVNGSMAIDHDGTDMWITNEGGGDRSILAEIDPARPGFEIWYSQDGVYQHPYHLRDAATGDLIWGDPWWELWDDPLFRPDNRRSVVADVDPANPGQEVWSFVSGDLFSATGAVIGPKPESMTYVVYWDGDLQRELVESGVISKHDATAGITSEIGATVRELWSARLIGDLFGDWREEIVCSVEGELRIYTTSIPATRRLYTLMHDGLYRNGIAMSASGLLPNGHPGFFLGADMSPPPRPELMLTPL